MKHFWLLGALCFGCLSALAQDTFQLAPPMLIYRSVFFSKTLPVSMAFAMAGTHIHYTLNGAEPTERDPVYRRPILLKKKSTTLKARVFGNGFRPSEVVSAQFFRQGLAIDEVMQTTPDQQYSGSGHRTLIDGQGGLPAADSKTWMGFRDTVLLGLTLAKPARVKQVLLQVLQNQGAWIYMPQQVAVYAGDADRLVLIGTSVLNTVQDDQNGCRTIRIDLDHKKKVKQIIMKIYPLAELPAGHPGVGKPAWLFLDEINLY